MNWKQLRAALLNINTSDSTVKIEMPPGTILNEKQFLKTHIAVVDKYPQISPRTDKYNLIRLTIAKPHFDRLMAYYLLKTQL